MKKQLFQTKYHQFKEKSEQYKNQNQIPSDEDQIKQINSLAQISFEEPRQEHQSDLKTNKNNIIHFEEFKIDPQDFGTYQNLQKIQKDTTIPKNNTSQIYFQTLPAIPTNGSLRNTVLSFPRQSLSKDQSILMPQLLKQLQDCKSQLIYKNGQISILQKFISNNLGKYSEVENLKKVQRIISDKDQKISELLSKLKQLSLKVREKSDEVECLKQQNYRIKSEVVLLQNSIYVLQKKYANNEGTRKFYEMKRPLLVKTVDKNVTSCLKGSSSENISQLQKRLNLLKTHNNEIESKLSNSSRKQTWTSQTSDNQQRRNIQLKVERDLDWRKDRKNY